MRIEVCDEGRHFDVQTRCYAEYRLFLALVSLAESVRHATVRLSRVTPGRDVQGANDLVSCTASITLETGRQLDVATEGEHPSGAIDRLAQRAAAALEVDMTAHSNAGGP